MWYPPGPIEPKLAIALVVAVLAMGWLVKKAVVPSLKQGSKQQICQISDECAGDRVPAAGH